MVFWATEKAERQKNFNSILIDKFKARKMLIEQLIVFSIYNFSLPCDSESSSPTAPVCHICALCWSAPNFQPSSFHLDLICK